MKITTAAPFVLTCALVSSCDAAADPARVNPPPAIPSQLKGTWDYLDGDCSPASKTRYEISAHSIQYLHSLGTVTEVSEAGDDYAVVSLLVERDDMDWERRLYLSVTDSEEFGQVLTECDYETGVPSLCPMKPPNRRRCP